MGPFISGHILGLREGDSAILYFQPFQDKATEIWTSQKNGEWKIAIPSEYDQY
jgi:hypothetical protein